MSQKINISEDIIIGKNIKLFFDLESHFSNEELEQHGGISKITKKIVEMIQNYFDNFGILPPIGLIFNTDVENENPFDFECEVGEYIYYGSNMILITLKEAEFISVNPKNHCNN